MHLDKTHIIHLVNELGISILALAFLIVSLTVYNKMSTDVGAFNQVSEDWTLPSIVDLQVVHFSSQQNVECPQGYTEFFTRKWSGTKEGCDCLDVKSETVKNVKHRNTVFAGACNVNDTQSGCFKVDPIPSKNISSLANRRICGLVKGLNFLESERPQRDGLCPAGYLACNPRA